MSAGLLLFAFVPFLPPPLPVPKIADSERLAQYLLMSLQSVMQVEKFQSDAHIMIHYYEHGTICEMNIGAFLSVFFFHCNSLSILTHLC